MGIAERARSPLATLWCAGYALRGRKGEGVGGGGERGSDRGGGERGSDRGGGGGDRKQSMSKGRGNAGDYIASLFSISVRVHPAKHHDSVCVCVCDIYRELCLCFILDHSYLHCHYTNTCQFR